MSPKQISGNPKQSRTYWIVFVVLFMAISTSVTLAQSSKPAPKGPPPKVIVPPKSDRDKPRESENKDERPKRP